MRSVFNFIPAQGDPAAVRVVQIDGSPWFVATDVCRALSLLGRAGASPHLAKLSADERRRETLTTLNPLVGRLVAHDVMGGAGIQLLVSESGLYKLVMRSDKAVARPFQDWVTRDVLPAIRKDGAYVIGEEKVRSGELTLEELEARLEAAKAAKWTRLGWPPSVGRFAGWPRGYGRSPKRRATHAGLSLAPDVGHARMQPPALGTGSRGTAGGGDWRGPGGSAGIVRAPCWLENSWPFLETVMRCLSAAALALLTACSSAADFTSAQYDRRSGDTAWRLDEAPRGFVVSVRQDLYRFIPNPDAAEASCRREAVALAVAEAQRRGRPNVALDERLVRSSFGRNGVTGITTCTAQVPVEL